MLIFIVSLEKPLTQALGVRQCYLSLALLATAQNQVIGYTGLPLPLREQPVKISFGVQEENKQLGNTAYKSPCTLKLNINSCLQTHNTVVNCLSRCRM